MTPYHQMSHSPQPPQRSILLSRPTHGLSCLVTAVRHHRAFLVLTSVMALLSEFLPLLLANVPFNLTQTYKTHLICARASLAIVALMIATLVGSLFVRWPSMEVDPRTVAGAVYYVSGSRVLMGRMEGVSRMDRKEREIWIKERGGRYFFGDVRGGRVGVEVDGPGFGDGAETSYRGNEI